MKKRLFAFLALCLLPGCLSDIRDQLDACTTEAKASYPGDKPTPMGEPYKSIVDCMLKNDYTLEYTLSCKDRDYTSMVTDPYCYRPTGMLSGYIHDVTSTLR